jgi:hypothetical protein
MVIKLVKVPDELREQARYTDHLCEHLYQKVARGAPDYVACLCDVGADDIRAAQSHRRRYSGVQSLAIGMLISSAIHPAKIRWSSGSTLVNIIPIPNSIRP